MTVPDDRPNPAGCSRRSLLRTAALAALVGFLPAATRPSALRPIPRDPAEAVLASTAPLAAPRAAGTTGVYIPAAPYTLTQHSQLSQDFLRTTEILLEETDEVLPFFDEDGAPAALVLSGDTVSIVRADPTAPAGYGFTALDLPQPAADYRFFGPLTGASVAVGNDGSGTPHVLVTWPYSSYLDSQGKPPAGQLPTLFVWGHISDGAIVVTGELDTTPGAPSYGSGYVPPAPPVPPRVMIDEQGTLRFYAFVSNSDFVTVEPATGTTEYLSTPGVGDLVDGFVCEYDGGYYALLVDGQQGGYVFDPQGNQVQDVVVGAHVVAFDLATVGTFTAPTQRVPILVSWGPDENRPTSSLGVSYLSGDRFDYGQNILSATGLTDVAVLPDATTGWQFLTVAQNAAAVAYQFGPIADYTARISDAVPFQSGVARVWAPAAHAPALRTLFVQRDDAALCVLAQGAAGTWTLSPIRRPATTVQELTVWRTRLSVRDAHGLAVPGLGLSVQATEDLAVWQASGSTRLRAGVPATFTTDALGQLSLSTPAVGLTTPTLTVSAPQLAATTVAPDADVHAYLAGSGSLPTSGRGGIDPTFTANTLVNASITPVGGTPAPLAPVIAGQSGSARTSAATAIVTTITSCVQAGLAAAGPGPTAAVTPVRLVDPAGAARLTTGPAARAENFSFDPSGWVNSLTSAFDTFEQEAEQEAAQLAASVDGTVQSVVTNAIDGVQSLTLATITTATGATDVVVQMAVTLADQTLSTFQYVVSDVRSALAAVTAVMKSIGADVLAFVKWLAAQLYQLVLDAWDAAVQLDAALSALGGQFRTQLTAVQADVAGDLTKVAATADRFFGRIVSGTAGSAAPSPTPNGLATAPVGGPFGGTATAAVQALTGGAATGWLLEKFTSDALGLTAPASTAVATSWAALLTHAGDAAVTATTAAGTTVATSLTSRVDGDPTAILDVAVSDLVGLLRATVDGVCTVSADLLGDLVTLLLDLLDATLDYLGSSVSSDLGYFGDLLSFLGVDVSLTLQKLLCLVVAFPAAVLVDGSSGLSSGPRPGDAQGRSTILSYSGVIAQVLGYLSTAAGDLSSGPVPLPIRLLGLFSGLVQRALSWPGGLADPKPSVTYENGVLDAGLPADTWIYQWLAGFGPTCVSALAAFGPAGVNSPEGTTLRNFLDAGLGAALTCYGTLLAIDQADTEPDPGEAIALAAIRWLTVTTTFLKSTQVESETEDVSLAVKVLLDVGLIAGVVGLELYPLTH